jgi:glycerol kinase
MNEFVGALDQGTTSTRFMVFAHDGRVVAAARREHRQVFPQAGWVEHDALEIWECTQEVIGVALRDAGLTGRDLAAVGVANQRETTVVWDRGNGQPFHNAIVWQDTRTDGICAELEAEAGQGFFRSRTGLPLATYFSGPKLKWILDHVPGARVRAETGDLLFGTIDSWCLWNLTGGPNGGVHVTDVTNASRTLMMDLDTLSWDEEISQLLGVPRSVLPEIVASSRIYAEGVGLLAEVPMAGCLGDQQAALFGQACFAPGEAKCTYGTGNFLLLNTGGSPVRSSAGLITGPAYKIGDEPVVYMLEGSVAVTGSLVQWLRDNLKIISSSNEVEILARSVDDNGGVYFVPAFSGLFAPYWRSDARGVICGLTRFAQAGHIARAALEATAWQTREVVDAMLADTGRPLGPLKVDGGMVGNEFLMQLQADFLGTSVVRPAVTETTALGAACAAGLAVGYWSSLDDLRANWRADKQWQPSMSPEQREREHALWKRAVTKSFGWAD